MKKSLIYATVLLLSATSFIGCQNQSKDSKRKSRVSPTTRGKLNIEEARQKASQDKAQETTQDKDIDENGNTLLSKQICTLNGQDLCSAIRVPVNEKGEFELLEKPETANISGPFQFSKNKEAQSASKKLNESIEIDKDTVRITLRHNPENQNAKATLVYVTNEKESKVKETISQIQYANVKKVTLNLIEAKKNLKPDDIQFDGDVLIYATNQKELEEAAILIQNLNVEKSKISKIKIDELTPVYEIESALLRSIGTPLYFQFELPDAADKIENGSVLVTVNDKKLIAKTDYDLTEQPTLVRLLKRSVYSNINDKIVIEYRLKGSATEPDALESDE